MNGKILNGKGLKLKIGKRVLAERVPKKRAAVEVVPAKKVRRAKNG